VAGYDVYVSTSPGTEGTTPVNGSLITGRSYLVADLDAGTTYSFVVRAVSFAGFSAPSTEVSVTPTAARSLPGGLAAPVTGLASLPQGFGYWLVNEAGAVSTHGFAVDYGSTVGLSLNAPIVGIASTPDGKGYWEVASDGGVFAFGDATFLGGMGGRTLNAPVVALTATPDGHGYWEVASDGGVFAFGDATFHGGAGQTRLQAPVTAMAVNSSTGGYWLAAWDGGVFSYDTPFLGAG
jgi:hypothetical protein